MVLIGSLCNAIDSQTFIDKRMVVNLTTMKDVAKLAGVSHGTVSNIINGANGVSIDKVRRVTQAMEQLGYNPNGIARTLKLSKTKQIDVILPKVIDASLAQIYECISIFAMERGYTASLYITNENAELETKILSQAVMYNKDGVILMTCQPNNTKFFKKLKSSGLNLVFLQRHVIDEELPFIGIDGKTALNRIVNQLLEQYQNEIAIMAGPDEYSFEAESVEGYKNALFENGYTVKAELCAISNYDRESSFKEAVRLLTLEKIPKVIVTTLTHATDAILKAFEILNLPKKEQPEIVALVPSTWALTARPGVTFIPVPYNELAEMAFHTLFDILDGKKPDQPVNTLLKIEDAGLKLHSKKKNTVIKLNSEPLVLRALLTKDRAGAATKTLVSSFEKKYGIKVEIDIAEYRNTYDALKNEWYRDHYDIFDLDVPWLQEFVQNKAIENLDTYLKNDPDYYNDVPKEIFDDFSICEGHVYGLPYIFSGQLLFYRQDLFSDIQNQHLFYKIYKKDLVPPATWEEFNQVANFFTKEYNPSSPTLYGTTLGSRMSSGAVCEYLPRLWGFEGQISDGSRFTLDSEQAIAALNNYKESFQYASATSCDDWWPEQARVFYQGFSAMMILFSDNVSEVTERSKSKIIGKIGYELIPDKFGVKGGWVLAINSYSKHKADAFKYISWACSKELSVISAILGGSVPCKTALENAEVANIYPWYRKTMESKQFLKLRTLPLKSNGSCMAETIFEDVLGRAVYDTVTGRVGTEEALRSANQRLNNILSDKTSFESVLERR
jgi:multiple sugar transport system substrate-binding protein